MTSKAILAVVVALAARGWGQTTPPPPAPSGSAGIGTAGASMVTHWAGCGASFSDPGFAGWCAIAVPVVSSRGLYSFSMYEFLPNSGKPPTTATITGLALLLREWQTKAQDSVGVYGIGRRREWRSHLQPHSSIRLGEESEFSGTIRGGRWRRPGSKIR